MSIQFSFIRKICDLFCFVAVSFVALECAPAWAACTYTLSSGGIALPPEGSPWQITVVTQPGCPWAAGPSPAGLTINEPGSGTGSGTFSISVGPNPGAERSFAIPVAGKTFMVEQASGTVAGLTQMGSLAQVVSGGPWQFRLVTVNMGNAPATERLTFWTEPGPVYFLPLNLPQRPLVDTPELVGILDRTIAPNAQFVVESPLTPENPQRSGWGQVAANGKVDGFGIFRNPQAGWNAVVPLENRNAHRYVVAFDNTGPLATGLAIANLGSKAASGAIVIHDEKGAQIGGNILFMQAYGHRSFMLNDPQQGFPVTAGKRGTIEILTDIDFMSVLGLRANGPALTTLPALASTDAPGGTIAHVTYNGGFTSTFYLVNTGAAAASFTLNFFDEVGNALTVPLRLPQSGTTTSTATLTQTLSAGALSVVETLSDDQASSVVGSAQLATNGGVSGFEVFKWTTYGQEASVPVETRTPSSFALLFDNSNGLTTGVALSNALFSADVTAKIYGEDGSLLQTATIPVLGKGHVSFLLPSRFPVTANQRGMVEFVVPAGGKISAIGLSAKADGTLTTIPVLAR